MFEALPCVTCNFQSPAHKKIALVDLNNKGGLLKVAVVVIIVPVADT